MVRRVHKEENTKHCQRTSLVVTQLAGQLCSGYTASIGEKYVFKP